MDAHVDVRAIGGLTDDESFLHLCISNKMLRIERTPKREIMLLHPTGGESGRHNADIVTDLNLWVGTKLGIAFESSTGFHLPKYGVRSPDAAFYLQGALGGAFRNERRKFKPLCPDFVIELLSESDSLKGNPRKDARVDGKRLPSRMAHRPV